MEVLRWAQIYQKGKSGKDYFNWPRLLHIVGLGSLSCYYAYYPKELLKISPTRIGANLLTTFSISGIFGLLEFKFQKNKVEREKENIEALRDFANEYNSLLKISFVVGEEIFFIPSFIYQNNIYVQMSSAITFGGMHYVDSFYSLNACIVKGVCSFLTLLISKSLMDRILSHFLTDVLALFVTKILLSKIK